MRAPRPLMAILVASLMLASVPLASSQSLGDDLADLLDIGSRRVNVGADGDTARVYVARENATGDDGILLSYNAPRGQIIINEQDQGERRAGALNLRLVELVEFRDTNGDGMFDPSVDTAVSSTPVRRMDWQTLPVTVFAGGHALQGKGQTDDGGRLDVTLVARGPYAERDSTAVRLDDIELRFGFEPPRTAANDTMFALLVDDQQRGAVAGLDPGAPFPWGTHARTANGAPLALVAEEGRAQGGGHRVMTYVSLSAGAVTGASDEDGDAARGPAFSPMLACALKFECA